MQSKVTLMIGVFALAWQVAVAQHEPIMADVGGGESQCLNSFIESQNWMAFCALKQNFAYHKFSDRAEITGSLSSSEAQKTAPNLSRYEEGSSLEMARQAAARLPISSAVINDSVLSYEAVSEEVIYLSLADGRYANQVFGGVDLRKPEQEVLESFFNWVRVNELVLPPGFADEHHYALRYLDSAAPDFGKAYDSILDTDQWLRNDLVPKFEDAARGGLPIEILENGMIYGLGRDREQRPIIVINFRRIIDCDPSIEELADAFDFVYGYTVFNALSAGQVEQFINVLDAKDVALYEIPVMKIATLMARNTKYYKHRLTASYIVNIGWLLKTLVDVFQGFMDPFQVQKTKFFGSDFTAMTEALGAENLESKYGGQLPNRLSDFFPPTYHP